MRVSRSVYKSKIRLTAIEPFELTLKAPVTVIDIRKLELEAN